MFFSNFQKFFCPAPGQPDRSSEQAEYCPHPLGQPQQRGQYQAAEGKKVQPAPQRHGHHVIDAHLPVVPKQGEGEQSRHSPQPEQQVQQENQRGQPQAPAQGAHSVIDQTQQHSQQDSLPKDRRLAQNVHVHGQRSSRARKPPRPPAVSSS